MGERRIARGLLALALVAAPLGLQLNAASGAESQTRLQESAAALRTQNGTLRAEAQSAWLAVVSLDTRLEQSQAALVRLRARTQAVARARAEAALTLRIAQRAVRISEQRLAQRLRVLYEQGDTDPLTVVLGASSIGEAIEGLDSLDRMAGQDREYVERAKSARARLLHRTRILAAREAEARRAEEAAAATAAALATAKRERAALLARIQDRQRENSARASSRTAQARALAAAQPAATPPGSPLLRPAPVAGGRRMTVTATGYALPGKTATGVSVGWGVVAVDPNVIPLGTRMTIPGYGEGIAADTGGAVRGAKIDLWFPTTAEALAWGSRTVTITLR